MTFASEFVSCAVQALKALDLDVIERMVEELVALRERNGRLFVLGVGGSAANASHAVNDFRKLCSIEAYTPTDNVSELTARTNDEGWEATFAAWLRTSKLAEADLVLVLSVGGGDVTRNISPNLIRAMELAQTRRARIVAIVGRRDSAAGEAAHVLLLVPAENPSLLTPLTETFQSLVLHLLVSHPRLKKAETTW